RVVERAGRPGAGVQRAGDEFPERVEVLEHRGVRIVVVRGRVVHVGGEPYRVADAGVVQEGQQIGDLPFAPARRAVALPDRGVADEADRKVGGDDLPGGT